MRRGELKTVSLRMAMNKISTKEILAIESTLLAVP